MPLIVPITLRTLALCFALGRREVAEAGGAGGTPGTAVAAAPSAPGAPRGGSSPSSAFPHSHPAATHSLGWSKTCPQQGRGRAEGALGPLRRDGMSSSSLGVFFNFQETSRRQGWQRRGTARRARKPTVKQPDASQSSSIRAKQAKAP